MQHTEDAETAYRWLVVHGSPRLAFRKLGEAGYQAFLPLERHRVGCGSQRRTLFTPLFGSYLFVKVYASSNWQDLLRIEGVGGLVGATASSEPAEVDCAVVDAMMAHGPFDRDLHGPMIRHKRTILRRNEMARVTSGSYIGFLVQFKSLDRKGRANVLWRLGGRSVPLLISADLLVRAPGAISPVRSREAQRQAA